MITSLLNADTDQMYKDMEEADRETRFAMSHPRIFSAYVWTWLLPRFYILSLICSYRGHNTEDDGSYATPDSGADHLRCSRCGKSWSHTYY